MAKPRVFVSSTYFDLKHIRSSVDQFLESLGFESILSENGEIAYLHDTPLDKSCYREASQADIFVLIISGRYGSASSSEPAKKDRNFYEKYESITKQEYESAVSRNIPIYVLIEKSVYAEYLTFLRNKENTNITYAHVESINVFYFIEGILAKQRNNPFRTFEKYNEIEDWLREQWSGLFRELLQKGSSGKDLAALSSQIIELRAINETLRTYLEALLKSSKTPSSNVLIESENRRLGEVERNERLRKNIWVDYILRREPIPLERIIEDLKQANDFNTYAKRLQDGLPKTQRKHRVIETLYRHIEARKDINEARKILGMPTFPDLPENEAYFKGLENGIVEAVTNPPAK